MRSPTPGVPLSRKRVGALAEWVFRNGPVPIKDVLGVAVSSADLPVESHRGSLLMITPEEKAYAILMKVAEDVRAGAKLSKEWKRILLRVPVCISVIPQESQVQ